MATDDAARAAELHKGKKKSGSRISVSMATDDAARAAELHKSKKKSGSRMSVTTVFGRKQRCRRRLRSSVKTLTASLFANRKRMNRDSMRAVGSVASYLQRQRSAENGGRVSMIALRARSRAAAIYNQCKFATDRMSTAQLVCAHIW